MARNSDPETELAARRDELARRLATKTVAELSDRKRSAGWAEATKIASEFVAGIVVGVGIGWIFDRSLGTAPFGLIVFLLLGFAAGVLNVLRAQGVVADAGAKLRGEPPKGPGQSGNNDT